MGNIGKYHLFKIRQIHQQNQDSRAFGGGVGIFLAMTGSVSPDDWFEGQQKGWALSHSLYL